MSYIQREIDRIKFAVEQAKTSKHYEEFTAAIQALEWALDPVANRSPFELITWKDDREMSFIQSETPLSAGGSPKYHGLCGFAQSAGGVSSQAQ